MAKRMIKKPKVGQEITLTQSYFDGGYNDDHHKVNKKYTVEKVYANGDIHILDGWNVHRRHYNFTPIKPTVVIFAH